MAEWTKLGRGRIGVSFLEGLRRVWLGVADTRETPLRISGDSMLPALPSGSSVVVRHTRQGIGPGSLVAYRRHGDLIVHRVVAIEQGPGGRVFLTKGDNNAGHDPPVPEREVLGRVVAVEPLGVPQGRDVLARAGGAGRWRNLRRRLGLP